jgi:hypothetical protein
MSASGYAVPKDPTSFLTEKLKKKIEDACVELVRLAPPQSFGIYDAKDSEQAVKKYVEALIGLLDQKPYLISELVKDDKQTARITYNELDKEWVRKLLEKAIRELRFKPKTKPDYTAFSSRIVPDGSKAWLEFRTVDCVFAAILAALGFRPDDSRVDPKGKDKSEVETAEMAEKDAEEWLAGQLNFARRVTPDVALIYVLEQQFGWDRVADGLLVSDFKKNEKAPSSFILSYQQNGDAWHTVYVDHPNNPTWTVIDRQATAKSTGPGKVNDGGLCDAWKIDKKTPGFEELETAWKNRSKK